MRRPLAYFACAFFLVTMVAIRLPWLVLCVTAAGLATAFLLGILLFRGKARGLPCLLLCAGAAAGTCCLLFTALVVTPIQRLQGQTHTVQARVLETAPGFAEDSMNVVVSVLSLDGVAQRPFRVQLSGIPQAVPGDIMIGALHFTQQTDTQWRNYAYSQGRYIEARVAPGHQIQLSGSSPTSVTRLRNLQYAASESIRQRLPLRLSSVAAAITVGDRRFLSPQTTNAYRAAGISHILVVSGLHLSLLCMLLQRLLQFLLGLWRGIGASRTQRYTSLACVPFVLFFMLFTGGSPSVLRSGIMWLFILLAPLFGRQSDAPTTLGAAALVLVLANPYAAADIGLLLSFAATAGALASGHLVAAYRLRQKATPSSSRLRRFGSMLIQQILPPVCISAATLPVLAYAGLSFSLLAPFVNLVVTALLPVIVVCGFFMAIPAGLPVLGWLGLPAQVLGGFILVLLEHLTSWCLRLSWAQIAIGGLFALAVVLCLYGLVALLWRRKKWRRLGMIGCVLLLITACVLHVALSANTVRFTVAGSGSNASLVLTSGRQAVVLYKGRQSLYAVETILHAQQIDTVAAWVDLRDTAQGTEYMELAPTQVLRPREMKEPNAQYQPIPGIQLTFARQGDGLIACLETDDFRFAMPAGKLNLDAYPPLDVLMPGSANCTGGTYAYLLAADDLADSANVAVPDKAVLLPLADGAFVWLRPGKGMVYRQPALADW